MDKIEVKCAYDAMVALEKLIPNPKNPNIHPAKQVEALCKIIKSTGWRAPITISRQSGLIVRGHGRFMAAVEMQCDEVPVDYQDYLSEAEELADLVADNRIAELSNLDDDLLRDLMENIKSFGFDMELTGFEISEIAELINTEKQGLIGDDEVPDVVDDPVTKTGDLFYLGGHRLLCGDATKKEDIERLMDGQRADMVFTDPPYNVDYEGYTPSKLKIDSDKMDADKYLVFLKAVFNNYNIATNNTASFYICHASAWQRTTEDAMNTAGIIMRNQIIWAKQTFAWGNSRYKFRHEPIFYAYKIKQKDEWYGNKTAHTLWEVPKPSANKQHPTMKPIALVEIALQNSSKFDGLVIDFFGGSGSTLMACEKLNRKCYMMEIDPHYCDVIVARWEAFTGNKAELIG